MQGDEYNDLEGFVDDLLAHPEECEAVKKSFQATTAAMIEIREAGIAPLEIAGEIRTEADSRIEEAKTRNSEMKNITCRTGCAHCCRQLVAVSSFEAVDLVTIARQEQIPIDYRRLMRQSRCSTAKEWGAMSRADRDCVFLKDNLCQVYEHRPLACRKYFTNGDPELCNIEANPGGSIPVLFNIDLEILQAATMNAFDTGFMPGMLLQALAHHQKG